MTDKDKLILLELKRRLCEVVEVLDLRLYGSRARGDAGEDSDMDVFLSVPSLDDDLEDRLREVSWEVGFDHGVLISMMIFTRHEMEDTPLRSSQLVLNVKEEGIKI